MYEDDPLRLGRGAPDTTLCIYLTTLVYLSAHQDGSDGKMKIKAITHLRIVIMPKYMLMWLSLAHAFLSELPSSFDSSRSA